MGTGSGGVELAAEVGARDLRHPIGNRDQNPITVVLAGRPLDSHMGVRNGLERHGITVLAEVEDADEAVEAALLHRPSVCLLDVDIPGGGIAAADRINTELPATKIALMSGAAGRDELREAILAGADGYLLRSTAADRLTAALTGLANGETALPRSLTSHLMRELRSTALSSAPVEARRLSTAAAESPQSRSRVLYLPRLLRHFRRRLRSGMPIGEAWSSARLRMGHYE